MFAISPDRHNARLWALRAADELDDVDAAVDTAMAEIDQTLGRMCAAVEKTQASGIGEAELRATLKQIRELVDELVGPSRAQLTRRSEG